MTDDALRAAYAEHLRARGEPAAGAPAAGACASPEDLLALVRGEGPEAHRLAVLDHVMGCARCRREFDLLRAVDAAGQAAERSTGATADRGEAGVVRPLRPAQAPARATRRWVGPVGLALAASLVLMVGVRQYRARDGAAGIDVERGTADGVSLVAPAAGAVPAGAPLRFVWHAVPGATRYDVEVLAPDGSVVVSAGTADTTWQPADARRLALGTAYQWWVRAVGDAGGAPRRSVLRPLRVTPR